MLISLLIFVLFLFAPADAALRRGQAECPKSGHATCSDGLDNDYDGTVDESAPAIYAWQVRGTNGYAAEFENGVYSDKFSTDTDSGASGGSFLVLDADAPAGYGEVALCGNFTNATYNLWVRAQCPINSIANNRRENIIWVMTSSSEGVTAATRVPLKCGSSSFDFTKDSGGMYTPVGQNVDGISLIPNVSPAPFALNGEQCLFFHSQQNIKLDTAFLNTSSTATPLTPKNEYTILEQNATNNTITIGGGCGEPAWAAANVLPMDGFNSSNNSINWRALHDATNGKFRFCGTAISDSELSAAVTTEDNNSIFGDDEIELMFCSDQPTSSRDTCWKFIVNLQGALWDGNWVSDSLSSTVDLANRDCAVVLDGDLNDGADDVGYSIECEFDMPFSPSTPLTVSGNVFSFDDDPNGTDGEIHGMSEAAGQQNVLAAWGLLTFSDTSLADLGGGGDETAPVLGTPVVSNLTQTGATLTATVNESSQCHLDYDTDAGSEPYASSTPDVASSGGVATVSISGLSADTEYFFRITCTDGSGNPGYTAEPDSFTTLVAVGGSTFVVDAGGGEDYTTIQACVTANAGPNVTCAVNPGTYTEVVNITTGGTAAGGYFIIQNNQATRPVIDGTNDPPAGAERGQIDIRGDADYVKIIGMEITNYRSQGITLRQSNSDHIQILNNYIHDNIQNTNTRNAIKVHGSWPNESGGARQVRDVLIDGNFIEAITSGPNGSTFNEAISVVADVSRFKITNNTLIDNAHIGIYLAGGFAGGAAPCSGTEVCDEHPTDGYIAFNHIAGNGWQATRPAGSTYDEVGLDIVWEYNTILSSQRGSVLANNENTVPVPDHAIYRYNVIYNSNQNAIIGVSSSDVDISADSVRIAHNTSVITYHWPFGAHSYSMFKITDLGFKNNISYEGSTEGNPTRHVGGTSGISAVTASSWDCNLYNKNLGSAGWFMNGTFYATFAAWQSGTGFDTNGVLGDPLFTNLGIQDFSLQSGSPARDAGCDLTTTTTTGSGTTVPVGDVHWFSDGFGNGTTQVSRPGDLVQVGSNPVVRITSIDYDNSTITVDQSISWSNGDGVNYPFVGSAPDIGAFEFGQ